MCNWIQLQWKPFLALPRPLQFASLLHIMIIALYLLGANVVLLRQRWREVFWSGMASAKGSV